MCLDRILAFLVVAGTLLCGQAAAAQNDVDRITIGFPEISDASTAQFLAVFRKTAEALGIAVDTIPYNPGSAAEVLAAIRNGASPIDLVLVSTRTILGGTTAPSLTYTSLISQPGLIANAEEAIAVQESHIGERVAAELTTSGLSLVSFWNRPSTAIAFTRRVENAEDFKGAKVISTSAAGADLLGKLGAAPLQMAFAEVQVALAQGVADAAESSKAGLIQSGFFGQFKEGTIIDNYGQNPGFLLANRDKWLSLSQRARNALQSSAESALQASHTVILEGEASLSKAVEEFGFLYASVGFEGWESIGVAAAESWLESGEGEPRENAFSELKAVKAEFLIQKGRGGAAPDKASPAVIMFATNRNDEAQSELIDRFGIEKKSTNPLTCGLVTYDQNSRRRFGQVQPGALTLQANRAVVGADECASLMASLIGDSKRLTIFFHGYYNTFESALRRAIGFTQDFAIDGPVVVWSWPSAGLPGEYIYDLNSVDYTERYIRDFVAALGARGLVEKITLVAHSMGSRVAGDFLEAAHANRKAVSSVIFAAADYPPSLFKQLIDEYGASAGLRTLYANEHDKALAFSRSLNREIPIGLGGSYLALVDDVETVDVSAVAYGFGANHAHAFDVEKVAKDISRLIHDEISAQGRSLHPADLNGAKYWTIQ